MSKDELASTHELLRRAFPDGTMGEGEYAAVLEILYPHLADENLVIVMAALTGRDPGGVLNDVYRAGSGARSTAREGVMSALRDAGFEDWLREA